MRVNCAVALVLAILQEFREQFDPGSGLNRLYLVQAPIDAFNSFSCSHRHGATGVGRKEFSELDNVSYLELGLKWSLEERLKNRMVINPPAILPPCG